jgi:hypothetical protein
MKDNVDKYLLMIAYASVDHQQAPTAAKMSTYCANSLHQAMLPLFDIPVDQFHPEGARKLELPAYVKEATVLDLVNGLPVISTFRHPAIGTPAFDTLHFVVEPGYPISILRANLMDDGRQRSRDEAYTSPMMTWQSDIRKMHVAPLYHALFEATLQYSVAAFTPLLPHAFEVRYDGFELSKAVQHAGVAVAPAISQYHHFEALPQAVQHLLLTPSHQFDLLQCRHLQHPVYFTSAQLLAMHTEPSELAVSKETLQPHAFQHLTHMGPGRYLELEAPVRDALIQLGVQQPLDVHLNGRYILKTEDYQPRLHGHLTPTAALRQIIDPWLHHGESTPALLPFETILTYERRLQTSPVAPVMKQQVHYHSDDLQTALFPVSSTPIQHFHAAPAAELDNSLQEIMVRDRQGQTLLHACQANLLSDKLRPGVYMAIAPVLLEHPDMQALASDQIKWGASVFEHGQLAYHQVAFMGAHETLKRTPGFQDFATRQMAHYLLAALQQRPALQRVEGGNIADVFALAVGTHWEVLLPDTPRKYISTYYGTPTPYSGMLDMHKMADHLFTGAELLEQELPLRLVSTTLYQVRDVDQPIPLLSRALQNLTSATPSYYLFTRDPDIETAFKMVVGPDAIHAARMQGEKNMTPRFLPDITTSPLQRKQ